MSSLKEQIPVLCEGDPRAGLGQGITVVVAAFLPIMAIVSLAPAVPSIMVHFSNVPHASTSVPLLVTAPGLMIAIFSPGMGLASDRVGRRPVLLVTTFFYAFLGVLPFFLNTFIPILASRLALGLCEAGILTVTTTLMGDYFDPAARRTWLTVQGVVGPIFGTLVIATAGQLTDRWWNGAFLLYSVGGLIFLAMLAFIFEPRLVRAVQAQPGRPETAFPWGIVAILSAVTLFSSIIYYVFIVQSGRAFEAIGITNASRSGLLISIASIGVPVGALLFGLLSRQGRPPLLIATFLACFGAGLLGIGLAQDYRTATALAWIQQIGAGMSVPSLVLWTLGLIRPEHRGRAMGFWSAAFFLGQFVSPLVFSVATAITGSVLGAFAAMGMLSLAGAVVAATLHMRRPAEQAVV